MKTLIKGIKKNWVNSKRRQMLFLALDSSGSMNEVQKAAQVNQAVQELVHELAQPLNKDAFLVSLVHFNDQPQVVVSGERATELAIQGFADLQPVGYTDIAKALESCQILYEQLKQQQDPAFGYLEPVFLLLSDGQHNQPSDPRQMAETLKQCGQLVTVAFGSDADEVLLKDLASSPQHFYRIATHGGELRDFLAQVGATLTMSVQQGASSKLNNVSNVKE